MTPETWETLQTDPVAWLVPPRYHPVFGSLVERFYERFDRNARWMPYLGLLPLALAVYAAVKQKRAALFWWTSGLVWMVLAMGTYLRFNGSLYPSVRLPFALVGDTFPFSTLRSADRFNVLVPLSLAMLVALALARFRSRSLIALAGAVIVFEYLCVPIPTGKPLDVSPFLARMAADGGDYAVLDLPMGSNNSRMWMYLQTVHGKPMVEGMVGRVPPHAYDFIESVPLLRAFRDDATSAPADVAGDLCRLSASGIRYVLLHAKYIGPEQLARWASGFPNGPVHRDRDLIVFATGGSCPSVPGR